MTAPKPNLDVFVGYVCPDKCCDVKVRLGPVPARSGPRVNRPWIINLNGIEKTAEAWATQFGCSTSRVRNRINFGQCVSAKRIYSKREGASEDGYNNLGGNRVGLWKGGFVPLLQSWYLRA